MASTQMAEDKQTLQPKANGDTKAAPGNNAPLSKYFPEDPSSHGRTMAVLDGRTLLFRKDVYCQAKLTCAQKVVYQSQDYHLIRFEINFMRSFSPQYRFRGADIAITVQNSFASKSSPSDPFISMVFPQALAPVVSEREVHDDNELTASIGASAGPGKADLSDKLTHQEKTTFKGMRKFHGFIKSDSQGRDGSACWRIYEEIGSKSGIQSIVKLAMLVRSAQESFQVKLEMSARMVKWPKLFGLHKLYFSSNFSANPTQPITIPPLAKPVDYPKLYKTAETMFLDIANIDLFQSNCKISAEFLDEERKILIDFFATYQRPTGPDAFRTKDASFLEGLKQYLANHDESDRILRGLEASVGIQPKIQDTPLKQDVNAKQNDNHKETGPADGPSIPLHPFPPQWAKGSGPFHPDDVYQINQVSATPPPGIGLQPLPIQNIPS